MLKTMFNVLCFFFVFTLVLFLQPLLSFDVSLPDRIEAVFSLCMFFLGVCLMHGICYVYYLECDLLYIYEKENRKLIIDYLDKVVC